MPIQDADRWNARYQTDRYAGSTGLRRFLVEHAHLLPESGLALDLAMGMGGSAGFLLARGLDVLGVDISAVAVRLAKQRNPGLRAVIADLQHFYLPPATFDLACDFYFLDRSLLPALRDAVKPGGLVVFETLTRAMLELMPGIEADYLLNAGELRGLFSGW